LHAKLDTYLSLQTEEAKLGDLSKELETLSLTSSSFEDLLAYMESPQKAPLNSQSEKLRTRAMSLLRDCLKSFYSKDKA
jgi:hypothetical protein